MRAMRLALVVAAWVCMGSAASATVTLRETARLAAPVRAFPNTSARIMVFSDQLPSAMSDAQYRFAATHYAGVQKMLARDADHLRQYNPGFIVLHYRLPLGQSDATVQIINGNNWVSDWAAVAPHDAWFYHRAGSRVFMKQWHWYLMDPSSGWRDHWVATVLHEVQQNHDDGVFADSCSVPNYFGGSAWTPALPAVDPAFERWWSRQIDAFLTYAKARFGRVYLIPNVGSWITTRDATDYRAADGVMIEGFGEYGAHQPFALGDWQLQMDRILALEAKGKIVIAQNYLDSDSDAATRRYYLANYLLIKGTHTYINYFGGQTPAWYPEWGLNLGRPLTPLPTTISALRDSASGLYMRHYRNGLVVVNPDSMRHTLHLSTTYRRVGFVGGGAVPASGVVSGWRLTYQPVAQVSVPAGDAAILVK